jgi:nucleotide-binding universal stress UspA family protein
MSRSEVPTAGVRDVVVGVDGSAASVNALRYARREARRLGTGVDVVHVAQGGVVETLVAEGDAGSVLVVGSGRRQPPLRLLTGNVTTSVAARCAVPVVSVPETWRQGRSTGVVLVGVKHPHHSEPLMAAAYAVALQRGSRLLVLHASVRHQWEAGHARHELDDLLAPWRERWPEVAVEVRSVHEQAAAALVTAAAEADELVIARRCLGLPAAAHLGSTARTLLLHAPCPVRVVPGTLVPVLPGRGRELAGAARV